MSFYNEWQTKQYNLKIKAIDIYGFFSIYYKYLVNIL